MASMLDAIAVTHPQGKGARPNKRRSATTATATRCEARVGWVRVRCDGGGDWWVPLRCKRCAGCQAWRRRKVVRRILGGLDGERWVLLVTLTTRPGTDWDVIVRRWSSLVGALRRRYGRLRYAVVREVGSKSGMRHLHAIVAGDGARWIPHTTLRRLWRSRTGAVMVNIKRVAVVGRGGRRGVARYVAKYVAKAVGDAGVTRHITYSQDWGASGPARPHKRVVSLDPPGPRPGVGLVLPSGLVVRVWCVECLGPPPWPPPG